MLQIRNLSFAYPGVDVLDRVELDLPSSQLCALFGPNGTGKTTLYRCVLGVLDPAPGGTIRLAGVEVRDLPARTRARRIAYVPQQHQPPFPYRVHEVVLMGRTPHLGGVFGPSRADRRVAHDAIERIGIGELAERSYPTLSGGQRQLVLLARALAQDAELFLLDEPTASLDFGNQLLVWRTVRHLTREGRTVLVCTHDPNHVLWFCDRVVVLGREGRIDASGPPAEVIDDDLVTRLYGPVSELAAVRDRAVAMPRLELDAGAAPGRSPTVPAAGTAIRVVNGESQAARRATHDARSP